jgi:hypothetical protein
LFGSYANQVQGRLGRRNPWIETGRKESLRDINRYGVQARAQNRMQNRYNPSRAWGGELAIGRNTLEARNRTNLSAGMGQADWQDNLRREWGGVIGQGIGIGGGAIPLLTGAANRMYEGATAANQIQADSTMNFWNNISSIAGDYLGNTMGQSDEATLLTSLGYTKDPKTGKWVKK